MSGVLLDTCTFAWLLLGRRDISPAGQSAIDRAGKDLFVSAVTFYEITQKVRLGKWDEMAPYSGDLMSHSYILSSQIVQLDGPICMETDTMVWDHRDPFDRLIAVTALRHRRPIVSADQHFDGIVTRIW